MDVHVGPCVVKLIFSGSPSSVFFQVPAPKSGFGVVGLWELCAMATGLGPTWEPQGKDLQELSKGDPEDTFSSKTFSCNTKMLCDTLLVGCPSKLPAGGPELLALSAEGLCRLLRREQPGLIHMSLVACLFTSVVRLRRVSLRSRVDGAYKQNVYGP